MTARVLGLLGSAESAAILTDIEILEHPSAHGTLLIRHGYLNGQEVVVFPRSGPRHPLPAHSIDARENIQILKSYGVTDVISSGMTGSLRTSIPVGSVLVLDQFLDFTRVPRPTFFDDDEFGFVDFSEPFCSRLRGDLVAGFQDIDFPAIPRGCYVGVDGPRFETSAEVRMFAQLGGDVVGCTVLPECVYAREAGLHYATVAGVVNLGAGLQAGTLHAPDWLEMRQEHMASIAAVLDFVTKSMAGSQTEQRGCDCPPIAYERVRATAEAMPV
jgi:5'-methylthioadenosine phosphorylase